MFANFRRSTLACDGFGFAHPVLGGVITWDGLAGESIVEALREAPKQFAFVWNMSRRETVGPPPYKVSPVGGAGPAAMLLSSILQLVTSFVPNLLLTLNPVLARYGARAATEMDQREAQPG